MTENLATTETTRTTPNLPMGNGSHYKTVAIVLIVGLGLITGIGYFMKDGFGIFQTDEGAFVAAGLSIGFLAIANVVVLWTLSSTIFRVRAFLQQSILLHEIIENNYARLQAGTEDLSNEVKELRVLLAEAKEALRVQNAAARERAAKKA